MTPDTVERRQLQTRRFEGIEEKQILQVSAQVLQDLGFNIDESETRLGIIVASKDRSAYSAGQITLAILVGLTTGVMTRVDKTQNIRVSLVARPASPDSDAAGKDNFLVRITVQRTITDISNNITVIEPVDDPEVYQEFFDKLSKSVFLEGQQL